MKYFFQLCVCVFLQVHGSVFVLFSGHVDGIPFVLCKMSSLVIMEINLPKYASEKGGDVLKQTMTI